MKRRFRQVRGTGVDDMRAVQVAEVAASLNSSDVFVLEVPSQTYIWTGTVSKSIKSNQIVLHFR